jgi:uncharacterized protein (DUF1786 family)
VYATAVVAQTVDDGLDREGIFNDDGHGCYIDPGYRPDGVPVS